MTKRTSLDPRLPGKPKTGRPAKIKRHPNKLLPAERDIKQIAATLRARLEQRR